jgi:hypothetical protein
MGDFLSKNSAKSFSCHGNGKFPVSARKQSRKLSILHPLCRAPESVGIPPSDVRNVSSLATDRSSSKVDTGKNETYIVVSGPPSP